MSIVDQIQRSATGSYGFGKPGEPKRGGSAPAPVAGFKPPKIVSASPVIAQERNETSVERVTQDEEVVLPVNKENLVEPAVSKTDLQEIALPVSDLDGAAPVVVDPPAADPPLFQPNLEDEEIVSQTADKRHWDLTTSDQNTPVAPLLANLSDVFSNPLLQEETPKEPGNSSNKDQERAETSQDADNAISAQRGQRRQKHLSANNVTKQKIASPAENPQPSKKVEVTIGTVQLQVLGPATTKVSESSKKNGSVASLGFDSALRRSGTGSL